MSNGTTHHVLPLRMYIGVWLTLMLLTAVTVWVSFFDFGSFNMIVAMSVATLKATLVALFFMHLFFDDRFNLLAFLGAFVFVGLFFTFTFIDEMTRGQYDPIEANFVKEMPPSSTAGQQGKKPPVEGHSSEAGGKPHAPAAAGH